MIFRLITIMMAISFLSSLSLGQAPPAEKKTIYWLFFELPGAVNLKDNDDPRSYIMDI